MKVGWPLARSGPQPTSSSPPTPTRPQSGLSGTPDAMASRIASSKPIREGSTSTRNGRRARGTSASLATASSAIPAIACACPWPEESSLSRATWVSIAVSARNPRPGTISSGTFRGGIPAREKSLRSASRKAIFSSVRVEIRPDSTVRSPVTTTCTPTLWPSRSRV